MRENVIYCDPRFCNYKKCVKAQKRLASIGQFLAISIRKSADVSLGSKL